MGAGRWKFVFGVIVCLLLFNCGQNESRINSRKIQNKEDRIEELKKHVKLFSEIDNAEYDLFNVNGFKPQRTSIPGSSSQDYKFVVRVKQKDLDNWTDGFIEFSPHLTSDGWMETLIRPRKDEWKIQSPPHYYRREVEDGVLLIVYPEEGIIFKRIYQN